MIVFACILGVILAVALLGWFTYIKMFMGKALMEIIKNQRALILEIEEEAINYGYPSDPLAYNIVSKIRETRKKENLK